MCLQQCVKVKINWEPILWKVFDEVRPGVYKFPFRQSVHQDMREIVPGVCAVAQGTEQKWSGYIPGFHAFLQREDAQEYAQKGYVQGGTRKLVIKRVKIQVTEIGVDECGLPAVSGHTMIVLPDEKEV